MQNNTFLINTFLNKTVFDTVVILQLKLDLPPLAANRQIQNLLQSSCRVHHGHVKRVTGER